MALLVIFVGGNSTVLQTRIHIVTSMTHSKNATA